MITLPPYLQPGDTIAIMCPAGYMPVEKAQACINTLQSLGFNVKIGKTLGGNSDNYFSGTDDERLQDLQEMLNDESVRAIMFARGGYGIGRIIDRIDFKKFEKHPKWLIGFSDITIILSHVYSNFKIAGLHSPMAGAFNNTTPDNEYLLSLKNLVLGGRANYSCPPHTFNNTGTAEGTLVGGNLSLLAHLSGTSSDIKTKNKILFVEDVGEYLYNIDRMFWHLKRTGKLDKLAGLIIGGFTDMKDTERPFGKTVYELIHDITKDYDYPVCFGFPVSHEAENYALKVGVPHRLTVSHNEVQLKELNQ